MATPTETPLPPAAVEWLMSAGWPRNAAVERLTGGMHSRTDRLRAPDGRTAVLKRHGKATPPEGIYGYEAAGLRALAQPGGPRVPAVCCVGEDFLLMEDLGPPLAEPTDAHWMRMGAAVAAMHRCTAPRFGMDYGPHRSISRQATTQMDDGAEHWLTTRLLNFLAWPLVREALTRDDVRRLERYADVFRASSPRDVPALIHGDLWHANAFFTQAGEPALIDPDADFGLREHDVALARQCGGIPQAFFDGYQEAYPLPSGWWDRLELYFACIPLGMIAYVGNIDGHLQQLREYLGKFV